MEFIVHLIINPDFYTVTFLLILGIACGSLILFIFSKYEYSATQNTYSKVVKTQLINALYSCLSYINPIISWLFSFIKRKESPPDDEEPNTSLFNTLIINFVLNKEEMIQREMEKFYFYGSYCTYPVNRVFKSFKREWRIFSPYLY